MVVVGVSAAAEAASAVVLGGGLEDVAVGRSQQDRGTRGASFPMSMWMLPRCVVASCLGSVPWDDGVRCVMLIPTFPINDNQQPVPQHAPSFLLPCTGICIETYLCFLCVISSLILSSSCAFFGAPYFSVHGLL